MPSGLEVLPERVSRRTSAPGGAWPSQRRRPQAATASASLTGETKVPSAAVSSERATTRAGLDVTRATGWPGLAERPVTCCARTLARRVHTPSPVTR